MTACHIPPRIRPRIRPQTVRGRALLLALALVSLAACGGGGSSSGAPDTGDPSDSGAASDVSAGPDLAAEPDTASEDALDCTPGTALCVCRDGACPGGAGLACIDGQCIYPGCDLGEAGCACKSNGGCDLAGDGKQLVCTDGVCVAPECPAGQQGCACAAGDECLDGLLCRESDGQDVCLPESCDGTGALGCPCAADRSCDAGLACVLDVCEDPGGCTLGTDGCPCQRDRSCDDGLACSATSDRCQPIACTPGTVGCDCDGGDCEGDAVCREGVCQIEGCPAGDEGCACVSGRCGVNDRGEQLVCESGVCRSDDCAPGANGCVCRLGEECDAAGDRCADGWCMAADCVAGTLHCPCAGAACASGLVCQAGALCVDGTGQNGGPCHTDGTCDSANRCAGGTCVACFVGSTDCTCDATGACVTGLTCQGGVCTAQDDGEGPIATIPTNPTCYTPCTDGLTADDGTYRACPADGLMAGCVGDLACNGGSCTAAGEDPPACADDAHCPDHQACMRAAGVAATEPGRCYSNCDRDSDCGGGAECWRHVCRMPCGGAADCAAGTVCELVDTASGYCMPLVESTETSQTEVSGSFALTPVAVELSNVVTSFRLTLTNDSPSFQRFTVRKLEHQAWFDDGSSESYVDHDDDVACDPVVDCPLFWLEMAPQGGEYTTGDSFEVIVDAGASTDLLFRNAGGSDAVRWTGSIELVNDELGTAQVALHYAARPDGQWRGTIYYFSGFGDGGLADWAASPTSRADLSKQLALKNAFLQRWAAFRSGRISYAEMDAVMTATETGSWETASELDDCAVEACYLYDGYPSGLGDYASETEDTPIPTGVSELPFALNLYLADPSAAQAVLTGRIESSASLHYAGDPAVTLTFQTTPDACDRTAFGTCLAYVESFAAEIPVGGRFRTAPTDTNCVERFGEGYELVRVPWLVPGFETDTFVEAETGLRYRYECRDSLLPFDASGSSGGAADPAVVAAANLSLAASNPVPDGRTRRRAITGLDGVLVNGSTLILLFEERMDSFMRHPDVDSSVSGDDGIPAYGYLVLEKEEADLGLDDENDNRVPDAFEGNAIEDTRADPDDVLGVACSASLLAQIPGATGGVTLDNAPAVITTLIHGVPSSASPTLLTAASTEQVHYWCEDTGLFDGGPDNVTPHGVALATNDSSCAENVSGACQDGGPGATTSVCELGTDFADCGERSTDDQDVRVECPAGSRVVFFTVDGAKLTQAQIAALPCQEDGTCLETLNAWRAAPDPLIQEEPVFRCASGGAYCDLVRADLRDGKEFFAASTAEAVLPSFRAELERAFRYKTRFQNRTTGSTVGFAPEICIAGSDAIPYCYDPDQIVALRERTDCLLSVWETWGRELAASSDPLAQEALDELDEFLAFDLATESDCSTGLCRTMDGFERLNAELLVMMGDEALTQAYSSRFDLAGSVSVAFEGSLFEDGGIDLSGIAGYELYVLYQATQYYQEALDRFYSLSPLLWLAVNEAVAEREDPDAVHRTSFVNASTVTDYIERLMRASTQKARAWSQIAERYQGFDRPDLATAVIERAYTATYLESAALSRLMQRIRESFLEQDRPQIEQVLENSQRRYRMALLEMRDVYARISDGTTIFGLEPDYVPFPTLTSGNFYEDNAFEKLWLRAWDRTSIARAREEAALATTRSFESDTAAFQSELSRIRTTYESQLGDVCGTFVADDGRVYPAIRKYAALSDVAHKVGDPCGFVGNGALYQALVGVDIAATDIQTLITRYGNVLRSIEAEETRVDQQCELVDGLASYVLCSQLGEDCENVPDEDRPDSDILTLQNEIREARFIQMEAQRALSAAQTIAELTACSQIVGTSNGGDCVTSGIARVLWGVATLANEAVQTTQQLRIDETEAEITKAQTYAGVYQTRLQCDQLQIDSAARMQELVGALNELDLEVLRAQYQLQLALSEIQRLHNQALRLQLEQEEVEQMTINVEAARNDPNIRLYRNDAVINADIAFEDALQLAYRATRAYEYYTSTSYAYRDQLYLTRMVAYGDYNLENYLLELQNEFSFWEEDFGAPDLRVEMFSLKDDILRIPLVDAAGRAYTREERTEMLHERLRDPSLLDRSGYLTIPFSTSVKQLSPLTRNHKLNRVEVDIVATDYGDEVARINLRMLGTGTIHTLEDETLFYRFPERTAVINAYFGGNPFFDATVYQNYRLRDRPFANTAWELVVNQRDEPANQDLDLQKVSDVRLFVYYTDFTVE